MVDRDDEPTPENVAKACLEAGMPEDYLSDRAPERLARYLSLLVKWNRAVNLVGKKDWRAILSELVADSWNLARFLETADLGSDPLTFDLGAGAGIPGIPLRLFWTSGRYRLVELRQKRCVFLRLALSELDLPRTELLSGRAEDFLDRLGPADCILSRAFKPWPEVLDLSLPRLRPGGQVLIMASTPPPEDLTQTAPAWRLLRSQAYSVAGKSRYFWSLSVDSSGAPASIPK